MLLVMEGSAPALRNELFVGMSRARAALAVAVDTATLGQTPRGASGPRSEYASMVGTDELNALPELIDRQGSAEPEGSRPQLSWQRGINRRCF